MKRIYQTGLKLSNRLRRFSILGLATISVGLSGHVGSVQAQNSAPSLIEMFTAADNICYGREYSKTHLAQHPKQRVAKISLTPVAKKIGAAGSGPQGTSTNPVQLKIKLKLANSNRVFAEVGLCEKRNGFMYCGIECDGGGFNIEKRAGNKILLKTGKHGFRVVAGDGCDGDTADNKIAEITRKSDDKAFLLSRLPASQCNQP